MNRSYIIKAGIAAILLASSIQNGYAQVEPINVTTTSVPFLRISPDTKAGGMGNIGIATTPDANSGFYNAAKIPFAGNKSAAGINYTPWLKDVVDKVFLASAGGYYQLDEQQALSAGLRYFNMGDLPLTDYSGTKLQTAHPREWALDVAYSRKLSNKLGIALALRYINSRLASGEVNGMAYKTGTAVSGDLSLYYNGLNEKGEGLTAGFVLSDLGSRINYTSDANTRGFIPVNAGIGAAYTKKWNEDHTIQLGIDINKLLVPTAPGDSAGMADYTRKSVVNSWFSSFDNGNVQLCIGGEYTFKDLFSLRLGYNVESKKAGDRKGFTTGVGIYWNDVRFNFSYLASSGNGVTRNPLSNTVRFGLTYVLKH